MFSLKASVYGKIVKVFLKSLYHWAINSQSPKGGQGTSNKKRQGVRMLRVLSFVKNYTIGCANSQQIVLLGALFLYTQTLLKLLACKCWP